MPYRYAWSQGPLLVTTSTLHGPSNDAASADVPAANIVTAKSVASVTARMEWLIMGTLVLRRLWAAPGCGRSASSSSWAERWLASLATRCGMVSRRLAAKEGVLRSCTVEMDGEPSAPRSCYYCVRRGARVRHAPAPENSSDSRRNAMKPFTLGLSLAATLAVALMVTQACAQGGKSGVERLYILNCGGGFAGDIARWSRGVNVGRSMAFADSCYLIKHGKDWFLGDPGVTAAIAAMPEGQRPADPRMTHWRRSKTLAAQLDQLGVKPSDIKYVAVSHTHPDHIGNMALFPQSMLLVQKAEYEWPSPVGPRFKADHPVTKPTAHPTAFPPTH